MLVVEGSDADQSRVAWVSLQDTRAEEEMEVWLPDGGCREIGVMRGVQTLVNQGLAGGSLLTFHGGMGQLFGPFFLFFSFFFFFSS